ncbi:hypothetical protein F5Y15DRAFT_403786 [Xylariaceae sp. FL0016]|nr:hypothetical protein F5Y15DRAFT_403786 [Xylariaceae sp. FL0016]
MPRKKNGGKGSANARGGGGGGGGGGGRRGGGRPKGPPDHIRRKLGLQPYSDRPGPSHFARGFTMAEEARNTAQHRRETSGRGAKLRYQPVTFISGGFIDPLKELDAVSHEGPFTMAEMNAETEAIAQQEGAVVATTSFTADAVNTQITNCTANRPGLIGLDSFASTSPLFTGNEKKGNLVGAQRPESEVGSDSSEEVILFKGRDAHRQLPEPPKKPTTPSRKNSCADSQESRVIDTQSQVPHSTINDTKPRKQATPTGVEYMSLDIRTRRPMHQRRPSNGVASDDEEAAIIADYIANMQHDDSDEELYSDQHLRLVSQPLDLLRRDLGGTDSDAVPSHLSTEEDSDDGSGNEDKASDEESQRRQLEAEDERLARLLLRQEEMGIGGDDTVLFDGAESDDWFHAFNGSNRREKKGGSKKDKLMQQKGQYPSATMMAQAFDDLDLAMDWHRPSLRNLPGQKGVKEFDISDSELEDSMRTAWKKDRLKKAGKKKAREELRSQGLLGKNGNPDDLRVKYRGGMSLDDLADEIEIFLTSAREQLILPPFDKDARKTIHVVASKFKLRSRSAGQGKDRYPILYRSRATLPFDLQMFNRIFGRIRQSFFPRLDVDEKIVSEVKVLKRAQKTRFSKNDLTLREGDIVGQHAAELGVENKGRAMLEKMGWSKGMALGTHENKGIVVPLTHVVKKTKAGLGDV